MAKLLRGLLASKPLEIGEPEEISEWDAKPITQRPNRFDSRHMPVCGWRNGLHALRRGQPVCDRQLVPGLGAFKASIR